MKNKSPFIEDPQFIYSPEERRAIMEIVGLNRRNRSSINWFVMPCLVAAWVFSANRITELSEENLAQIVVLIGIMSAALTAFLALLFSQR